MPVTDQWYIAIDPARTETKEVPSDLRGLDRIEYASYSELKNKLSILIEQRYPRRTRAGIDEFLEERRRDIRRLVKEHPGLTITSLAQLLEVEVPVAQLAIKPIMEEFQTSGVKKSTKYYLKGATARAK
jgi:hypothetical protein